MSTSGLRSFVQVMVAGLVLLASAHEVRAGVQRTFVASTGNDAHPCSLAQPCRSFGAAVAKTNASGEVIVLDSAGYGAVVITQSVSIIAPSGVYAGVSVFSGSGITIAGTGIVVVLRGLAINGQGGDTGINLQEAAALVVENCEITNLTGDGIVAFTVSNVTIKDSVFRGNGGSGVDVAGIVPLAVSISHSTFVSNGFSGVSVAAFSGGAVSAIVAHSILDGNGIGLQVQADPGTSASILSDANSISHASTAAFFFTGVGGSEIIYTPGNNTVGYYNALTNGPPLTSCCAH